MTPITFSNVSFTYPEVDEPQPAPAEPRTDEPDVPAPDPVFTDLSVELPGGCTFLVGPNGIGKSTLMLLAGARLFPENGTVTIGGRNTREFENAGFEPELEVERNELVSFVYQNMEFETVEPLGEILPLVAENGPNPAAAATVYDELVEVAGLRERLSVRMHELSKGEMQRAILAMSVLYQSPVIMMDEPVFAVEPTQADRLFGWLADRSAADGIDIYASVHDVEMAKAHARHIVLMHTDGTVQVGDPEELLARDSLETAFRAPFDTLYQRQNLYRELLRKSLGDEAGR
ncbi:MAG: ABC transporter ATP-binding protein [Spirochaeta sp.]|jgi:ABC-type cobalamin/Fe3+-siderophores transport system ATPase subunit|nr:ABC transporter ATP-binding protein [Spirochaeta sp.]